MASQMGYFYIKHIRIHTHTCMHARTYTHSHSIHERVMNVDYIMTVAPKHINSTLLWRDFHEHHTCLQHKDPQCKCHCSHVYSWDAFRYIHMRRQIMRSGVKVAGTRRNCQHHYTHTLTDYTPEIYPGNIPRKYTPEIYPGNIPRKYTPEIYPGNIPRKYTPEKCLKQTNCDRISWFQGTFPMI
jgi:hypothetical protein